MSGENNKNQKRIKDLLEISLAIIKSKDVVSLIKKHNKSIEQITPKDIIILVDKLVRMEFTTRDIKKGINKMLNLCFVPLNNHQWDKPEKDSFLFCLIAENREMEKILGKIKVLNKKINNPKTNAISGQDKIQLEALIFKLQEFNLHYEKKENILFPYLEKYWEDYRCLHIMWSFHDDIRNTIKKLIKIFKNNHPTLDEFNREIGKLFFLIHNIIFREESILFPIAVQTIHKNEWEDMHFQSFDIGFAYIQKPHLKVKPTDKLKDNSPFEIEETINLKTGKLPVNKIMHLLNTLPVDITFVNQNDEVQYFSNPKHRIFPRSQAILGRKVKNCHPPESMATVEEILQSFKSGQKDQAQFWIRQNKRLILIKYFALKDQYNNYLGTLEVSQDISSHQDLKGERRLLDRD